MNPLTIRVEHQPSPARLRDLGVDNWPIWEKGVSEFPWTYDETETCYVLEGQVIVTPDGGAPVELKSGDLAVLPAGLACRWQVLKKIRKRYSFS
jgi:hypothetical protein